MTTIMSETATSQVASVEAIRSHFPALERMHGGRPVAYFDGPGGTQVPRQVVDLMADYLFNHNANTHWNYPTSAETDQSIDDARRTLCEFLGASVPEEIVFGPNMTTLAFHLGRALGRHWSAGDEIVVTELDHHANIAPWRAIEHERGVTIRSIPFRLEDGTLDLDRIEAAIGPRTRLVAVGAASNAIGTINDIARICAMARAAGALSFVDAVHYAPHELVDAQAIGCDFLACSAYKFYGPHLGILYGRLELLERLDVPKLEPAPDTAPERLELGTQNHEGIVGAAAAVNFLASLAGTTGTRRERLVRTYEVLRARGDALITRLWRGLESIDGLRLYGSQPGNPRTPTLSFTLKSLSSGSIASALADRALFASNGDFYAATVVERYGAIQDGFLRVGCSCYTSVEEADRLLEAVSEIGHYA